METSSCLYSLLIVQELIKNEASGSVGSALSKIESTDDDPPTSTITEKGLLGLVKGEAQKYIPEEAKGTPCP